MLKQSRPGRSSYKDTSRSSGIRHRSSSRTTMPQVQIVRPGMSAAEAAIKDQDSVRFVPLGGLEEVGRNCSFFEYKDEIIIIDVGIQFPEETTPGVDYIIPNIEYLEKNKDKIKAILLTHGHYDHIAAIHYVVGKIANPLIYTADFTKAVVEKDIWNS